MEIQVRLYGLLGKNVAGHDPLKGMRVEMPDGSTIKDLMTHLSIPRKKVGIISVDGDLAKETSTIQPGSFVRMYRPISGG
jgi:sulfur carrier protein ThiS